MCTAQELGLISYIVDVRGMGVARNCVHNHTIVHSLSVLEALLTSQYILNHPDPSGCL